jgi:EpsI family protein
LEKIKYRYTVLIFLLILTGVLVNILNYNSYKENGTAVHGIENIPVKLGKWNGENIPLEDRVYQILETQYIIHRNYLFNGKYVFLSIVYYPETKVDFHSPEGCLGGQGIEISKTIRTVIIQNKDRMVEIELNQLVRKTDRSNEVVYYFYKAGDFLGQNYFRLRMNLAMNKFLDTRKSGSLIRISTSSPNGDIESASVTLNSFIKELYPFIIKYL